MSANNHNQNRREFLISSVRKIVLSGLALIGTFLGYRTMASDKETVCEVNLPCRNCFKLGNCAEDKAAKMRSEIRQKNQPPHLKNRKDNG